MKRTVRMQWKKEVKNSVVYEPMAGQSPADCFASSAYISKLSLGLVDMAGDNTNVRAPQMLTLTLETV